MLEGSVNKKDVVYVSTIHALGKGGLSFLVRDLALRFWIPALWLVSVEFRFGFFCIMSTFIIKVALFVGLLFFCHAVLFGASRCLD
jgi:hypothetical protein